ncbi:MAG: flippase-like domain-containing protein [Anaerolineae bacterium]|nr:flippase-like domain-containing protein [Anaerolineae bacterium]
MDNWVAQLKARMQVFRWILSLSVMVVSLWLLTRELDWAQLLAALRAANYTWVIAGVLAIVGTFFARVWRWQALLWRANLRFWPAMTALLVGQVANMVLPMRGGDLVRAMWVRPERGTEQDAEPDTMRAAGASEALGSVALEKAWDMLALLLCGLLLLALAPLPEWFSNSTWSTAVILVVGGLVLWAGLRWQEVLFRWAALILARFPAGWDKALLPRLQRLAQGLNSLQSAHASGRVFIWTVVTWGFGAISNWAVMRAFDVNLPVAAVFLLATLMVGNAVVPTPARLGVFEGICVVSLGLFEVPDDVALAIGLVLHLVVMGPPLITTGVLVLGMQIARRVHGSASSNQRP